MSPRDHDPDLRELISADDTLHEQLARLDRAEPPEELDRIVIERARQAIRMPRAERPIRQVRWAVPLALAATLLISFALVLHQMGPQQPAAPAPTAATQESPTESLAAEARVEDARADQATEPGLDAPQEEASNTRRVAAVAQTRREANTTATAGATAQASRAEESVESATTARVNPDAELAKRQRFESVTVAGSSALEDNADAAVSKPAMEAQVDSAQRAGGLAGRAKGEAKTDFRSDPDAWIAYIGRLRHVGRSDEADRELAQFRQVFPQYKYAAPAAPAADRPAETIAPEK